MTDHSPLPWKINKKTENLIEIEGKRCSIATVAHWDNGPDSKQADVNAAFIVQSVNRAPIFMEMLETLQGYLNNEECDFCCSYQNDDNIYVHEKKCELVDLIARAEASK